MSITLTCGWYFSQRVHQAWVLTSRLKLRSTTEANVCCFGGSDLGDPTLPADVESYISNNNYVSSFNPGEPTGSYLTPCK